MWTDITKERPPIGKVVLVSDGSYIGLAQLMELSQRINYEYLHWQVPGVGGWELDQPTHWQEIILPAPPR